MSKIFLFFIIALPVSIALSIGPYDAHSIRLVVVALFVWWSVSRALRGRLLVPPLLWSVFFVVMLLVFAGSLFYAPETGWTLRKILFLCGLAPLFVLTYGLLKEAGPRYAKRVTQAIGWSAVCATGLLLGQFTLQFVVGLPQVIALWQKVMPLFLGTAFAETVVAYNSWLVHIAGRDLFRAIGFFPDPHTAAFFLELCAPFIFTLPYSRRVRSILFVLAVIALMCTFARGAYVGLIAGGIVGCALLWRYAAARERTVYTALVATGVLLLFIPQNPLIERFASSFDRSDNSVQERLELLTQTWETIQGRPLLGTGLGGYSITANPRATYREPFYAHNTYLDLLVELGLVGCAAVGMFVLYAARALWKLRDHLVARVMMVSMSLYAGHGIFDTALFSVHVSALLFIIFGLICYYDTERTTSIR